MMKQQDFLFRHLLKQIIKALINVLAIAILAATLLLGRAYALPGVLTSSNEFYGTSSGKPSGPAETTPKPTPNPTPTPKPTPDAAKPSMPPASLTPPAPVPDTSKSRPTPPPSIPPAGTTQPPPGAFDTSNPPKTADNADPKILLAGLAIGISLLRYTAFNRKGGTG